MSATPSLMISNVHELVMALTAWHQQQVAILEHMLTIPEGTEMTLKEGDNPIPLAGDAHAAFRAGVMVSLSELGTLPFDFTVEPAEGNETPQADAAPVIH